LDAEPGEAEGVPAPGRGREAVVAVDAGAVAQALVEAEAPGHGAAALATVGGAGGHLLFEREAPLVAAEGEVVGAAGVGQRHVRIAGDEVGAARRDQQGGEAAVGCAAH
jgi:hypothetical protein